MISTVPLPNPQFHPTGITIGSDGNLWCVGFMGNNDPKGMIWRITPSGKIREFPVPNRLSSVNVVLTQEIGD